MSNLLPPIPKQPMDPTKPESVAMWRKQFFDPIFRILGKAGGAAWEAISKAGSSLKDLETRKHSDLQDVGGWTPGTGTTQDQHISPLNGKEWDDHAKSNSRTHHGVDHDAVYASHAEIQQAVDAIIDTDPALSGDSDTRVPSQKAVRAYADAFAKKDGSTVIATLTTGDIGATAAKPWKLGTVKAGAAVLKADGYVEVEINGVTVKLGVVQ